MTNLKKIAFDYPRLKLNELYFNQQVDLPNEGVALPQLREVFGRDLMFGAFPEDRPYAYNSLVMSVDGKIAFADAPQGPLVARNNKFAGDGSMVDYWILNVLRGSADAILCGTQSIAKEVNSGGTGHCYDANISAHRVDRHKNEIPWRIVVTLDGTDIAFEAAQFTHPEMPSFFYTTSAGVEHIRTHSSKEAIVIGPFDDVESVNVGEFVYDPQKSYIIVTNRERKFDNRMGMKILKKIGVDTLLVESPTVTHIFMKEGLMDELFLNQSGLYIGGDATSIGQRCVPFSSIVHPHTELVSIYMHSPHFIYCRYRLHYE
ncbi:MAG: hypothetical protein A2Y20_10340 [Firmicutes bacterium GWF2_51_9]|nr:MAG: hypothetical protein A2Y20_10340 [Firmicutes bacterium GWF2_51_9]OGS59412.1 MAG: hypothetical protein A2Y19_09455 [Firmicutes bacterium GWE2_51_13]HAM63111.1 hypothetical protein [Erysipelotrichaceae bacterium]HAO61702.1 hypothetical protein [Erysipelotrichaceae bacterium]HBZ40369.1 hypothetical protein [Erysipelotrichaceae bacterium]